LSKERAIMNKSFAILLSAVLLCGLTGCNDDTKRAVTGTSVTSAESSAAKSVTKTEKSEISFEDVLKNDVRIDGISVSIPCTLSELIEALGEDYSIDEEKVNGYFYGEETAKTKYFTGEYVPVELYYKGEGTGGRIYAIADPEKFDAETANVIGYFGGIDSGTLNLADLNAGDSTDKCSEKYGEPEVYDESERFIFNIYQDDDGYLKTIVSKSDSETIYKISGIGFQMEYMGLNPDE